MGSRRHWAADVWTPHPAPGRVRARLVRLTLLGAFWALMSLALPGPAQATPSYRLQGVVEDTAGHRLRGVEVDANIGGRSKFSTRTGTDGAYSLSVAAGTYEVTIEQGEGTYPRASLHSSAYVEELSITEDVTEDFVLPVEGEIDVHLLNAAEQPVGSASVCLRQSVIKRHTTTTQGTPAFFSTSASECGETDDHGNLPLFGFEDGTATITVSKAKELSLLEEAEPSATGTPLTIDSPSYPWTLRGFVHDTTEAPLRGASVTARLGTRSATTTTAGDGSYMLFLPTGAYSVQVVAEQPSYLHEDLGSEADIEELSIGEELDEDFVLPAEGELDVQLFDAGEQPVPAAQVCLSQRISTPHSTTPQGTPVAYFAGAGSCEPTDASGIAPLYGFVDGPATVTARRELREVPVTAEATPGTPASLSLFLEPPAISKLSIKKGPAAGGTTVSITGLNLEHASAVMFGEVAASTFHVNSPTSISAIAPPNTSGQVDVRVRTKSGESAITTKDRFKYDRPTVATVSPPSGPAGGGTSVTVIGNGFATGSTSTAFDFGRTLAPSASCVSTTECTVVSPPGKKSVDIVAAVGKLKSSKSPSDRFEYR